MRSVNGRPTGVAGGPSFDTRPDTVPWLVARASFGHSTRVAAEVAQLGHDGWIDAQLEPQLIDDDALEQKLAAYPWLTQTAEEIISDPSLDTVVLGDVFKGLRFVRAVESKRQLFERVVFFWEDHFNVSIGRFLRLVEDRTLFRPNALGTFRDLLHAVSTSASMLAYLNNELNIAGAGNENLAREILELHTLGVDGPYTEQDVREFARVLTGWTYDQVRTNPTFGQPHFDPALHDYGAKTILGQTYQNFDGAAELGQILDMLAMHPSTISHVTARLGRFLLGEEPPRRALLDAEAVWVSSGGDIKEIVRSLLREPVLAAVALRGGTKFRRPFDWFASLFRSTGAPLPAPLELHRILQGLGQAPFEWGPPDGYPDDRTSWAGFVQPRWAVAAGFARPAAPWSHTGSQLLPLVQGVPRAQWALTLSVQLAGGRLSAYDASQIQGHVDALHPAMPAADALGEAIELVFSCPSYQLI